MAGVHISGTEIAFFNTHDGAALSFWSVKVSRKGMRASMVS